jgi:RNA polymerase sigma-70 factor (ECF subfamily)
MSKGLDRPAVAPGIGESFDTVVLPHLDAAYRLARWLMRDADVAEDVVQEASLRAFRYFQTFVGGDGRAWFLRIVRNTCYGWRRHRYQPQTDSFDDEQHSSAQPQFDPEMLLLQIDDATLIARALSSLPGHYHQLLVLRELEGLSYRELSEVIGIPMGTVMSRLSRAREALRRALGAQPAISPRTSQPEAGDLSPVQALPSRRLRGRSPDSCDSHPPSDDSARGLRRELQVVAIGDR